MSSEWGLVWFEPSLNTISCNGKTTRLEPKVMEVLVCLAQHPGETLPKEKLLQSVWPDTFVTEDVLKHSISELRRVFEDDAREPHVIQTISKRGYRLLARVEPVNGAERSSPPPTPNPVSGWAAGMGARKLWIRGVAIAAAALLAVSLITFKGSRLREWLAGTSGAPPIHSIAVLPLQNLSGDPGQEYFSDGMTETLITDLAQVHSLRVISRTSAMHYKNTTKPLSEIAGELSVDAVVEGAVIRSGSHVRITAQLIRASNDQHLWAESYDRDMRDILSLQGEVARDIAQQVEVAIAPDESARLTSARTTVPEAYEAYLQGRFAFNKATVDSTREAIRFFGTAIGLDPQYALAYSGLADSLSNLAGLQAVAPRDVLPRAKAAAERAVMLDDKLAEGHASLALVYMYSWNWRSAEAEFRRAIEQNPSYSLAHEFYGAELEVTGHIDEALAEMKLARKLDPASALVNVAVATVYYLSGRYDDSIQQARISLELDPTLPISYLPERMATKVWSRKGFRNGCKQSEPAVRLRWQMN
jgi:TolB-like protein/DNA-binding winged helix-turn-helix (wHTH) protein